MVVSLNIGETILAILMVLPIIMYYLYTKTRHGADSTLDEPLVYLVIGALSSYFSASIILGQFAHTPDANNTPIAYGALGWVYYGFAALLVIYFLIEAASFIYEKLVVEKISKESVI